MTDGEDKAPVVELRTATDADRARVVGKLQELLGLAQQGRFREFVFVATPSDNPQACTLHWTDLDADPVRLVGQLEAAKFVVLNKLRSK